MMTQANSQKLNIYISVILSSLSLISFNLLSSHIVSADINTDIVDDTSIIVPVSCTLSGNGMNSHTATITNGTYQSDIGTTTLKAFCNDPDGFAIYAAGYTGDTIGAENSNKLVGTPAGIGNIVTGIATTAGNPDISNWAMKLTATGDSGDTSGTNALTIDSAPNTSGGANASFANYHVVPNEYVKVAHKDAATNMDTTTGGATLTTTYAAYISRTQPAGTYQGQVIYTLVHPSSIAPVAPGYVAVNYNANGSTFPGGTSTNRVVYTSQPHPMYIATTPQIAKTSNIGSDGTQNGSYATGNTLTPITATGASKMKVVIHYGFSAGAGIVTIEGDWDGQSEPDNYEMLMGPGTGTATYTFDSDTVTFMMMASSAPTTTDGQDYGYYAEVYPVYNKEQTGTEPSVEFTSSLDEGAYIQTTDWYGSWYADIDNQHYDFTNETEIITFLNDNATTLSGVNIDLYRGLTINEAYVKANKMQSGGYYIQQDMNNDICQTVAISQNGIVKDSRDNNTYMIGRLKDGRCWMLDNLALDPTDSTIAANMSTSNTNATTEAIQNYLNGGSSNAGWSNTAVVNVTSGFNSYTVPMINTVSKNTLVTSYGPASTNGQAKVGVYYNFCAAAIGTYCYANTGDYLDVPDTLIDASQDICPANWRMPTGGTSGEYGVLLDEYNTTQNITDTASLPYNLSTPLSGDFRDSAVMNQGGSGFWWSSTVDAFGGGSSMYLLAIDTQFQQSSDYYYFASATGGNNGRYYGSTLRCLVSD